VRICAFLFDSDGLAITPTAASIDKVHDGAQRGAVGRCFHEISRAFEMGDDACRRGAGGPPGTTARRIGRRNACAGLNRLELLYFSNVWCPGKDSNLHGR
jgi:hypothetical protein